jgi:hypothetical protein
MLLVPTMAIGEDVMEFMKACEVAHTVYKFPAKSKNESVL